MASSIKSNTEIHKSQDKFIVKNTREIKKKIHNEQSEAAFFSLSFTFY